MTKTVRLGTLSQVGNVFCKIKFKDGKLSISGVEGPMSGGDARGSCGQIEMHLGDGESIVPAPGWDHTTILEFLSIWRRWHLNDLNAGCEHQRAEGWDKRPIDPSKPLNSYGKHFPGQRSDSWNMLTWVRPDEHPDGLLTKACSTCGYKYGSEWRREEVPASVIEWLSRLPDTDLTPAWV